MLENIKAINLGGKKEESNRKVFNSKNMFISFSVNICFDYFFPTFLVRKNKLLILGRKINSGLKLVLRTKSYILLNKSKGTYAEY